MTDPQQPGGWSDPTWPPNPQQHPTTPAPVQPAYDPYGQQGYGAAEYGQPAYGQPVFVNQPTNGMAIAALVCSLAGLAVFITAPVGAILGHIARRQIRETGEQGDGMALAGIIVGWVITGLGVCACVAWLGLYAAILGGATAGSS